jgi:predicted transcriptional regulator
VKVTEKRTSEMMRVLGLSSGSETDSRTLTLLKVILRLQQKDAKTLTFAQIYDAMIDQELSVKLSRTWVHRVLKSLVDYGLVRVESESAYRKRYYADINTLTAGLEYIKSKSLNKFELEIRALQSERQLVSEIDCGRLAQKIVQDLTGKQQQLSSRFIKNLDEFYTVTEHEILNKAKKGDIVRVGIRWINPFIENYFDRTKLILDTAKRGVDVRYSFPKEALLVDDILRKYSSVDEVESMLLEIIQCQEQEYALDIRIFTGLRDSYQFYALNKTSMVFLITETPLCAAWITGDFNTDLINNAITTFDKQWPSSVSLFDINIEKLKKFGAKPSGIILQSFQRVMNYQKGREE